MNQRFCPNCGSTHVKPDTSNGWAIAIFGGNPDQWQCRECGYSGLMPAGNPEEKINEKEEEISFEPDQEYNRVDIEATPKFVTIFAAIILIGTAAYLLYLNL